MNGPDVLGAVGELMAVLEALGVKGLIGGSLASSTWGEPRFTQDVDIVADLREEHARPLAERLASSWYVDEESIREAVRAQRSFNVIKLRGMVKIDVFVPPEAGHHLAKWSRARRVTLDPRSPNGWLVTSAEDIVLQKLVWYRMGDEVSEQQWRDVTSLLRVRNKQLDFEYLRAWAARLAVTDLLERAWVASSA